MLLANPNWRCWSFKNCLGQHDSWQSCWESIAAGLSCSGDNAQKHHPAPQPHLRATPKPLHPLPHIEKDVQSFHSCCIPLRRTRAAPFLQCCPIYLALMCLAPRDPSRCNSREVSDDPTSVKGPSVSHAGSLLHFSSNDFAGRVT